MKNIFGFLAFLFLISIAIFINAWSVMHKHNNFKTLSIQAPPYKWPSGCHDRDYSHKYDVPIDRECANNYYLFDKASDYGLTPYHNAKYYRVGDNLIQIGCGFFNKCNIYNRYIGVFHR